MFPRACPIIDIELVTSEEADEKIEYVTAGELGGLQLIYTTKTIDQRPISSFAIEDGVPCAYPDQVNEKLALYPLEADNFESNCQL